jgi:Na+-transporting NADH:ubiquinone oxidoreductase subunit E
MAIGFMSFGGMLTGGDSEEEVPAESKTAVIKGLNEDVEDTRTDAKEVANNLKVTE